MSLKWNGDAVQNTVLKAALYGVDKTMSLAVGGAKRQLYPGHGVVTATLQGSIQMRPAVSYSGGAVGEWGSFDVAYADFIERGGGAFPGYGYLRTAADAEYPKLGRHIQERLS